VLVRLSADPAHVGTCKIAPLASRSQRFGACDFSHFGYLCVQSARKINGNYFQRVPAKRIA
jgi:hypothetical protein